MNLDTTITTSKILIYVKRIPSDDGRPLWRAWIPGPVLRRRHGRTREEAIDNLSQAFLLPVIHLSIGKGDCCG